MKLTAEEQEDLRDLTRHEGYKVLVKVLGTQKAFMDRSVLECDLLTDSKDELTNRKLRAEGAAQLVREVISFLEKTKHPPLPKQKAKKGRLAT